MDTVEDVGEIRLWIDAVQLGGLDDGHGSGQGFGTGVCPCKKPILASNADWAQGAFSRIVVDGHTTIGQEQAEGLLTTEAIAKGAGQIALAWNTQELLFGPGKEGLSLWSAQLLTRRMANVSGLTVNVALMS